MTIAEFQDLIRTMYLRKDVARGVEGTFMWLIEEVGEPCGSPSASFPPRDGLGICGCAGMVGHHRQCGGCRSNSGGVRKIRPRMSWLWEVGLRVSGRRKTMNCRRLLGSLALLILLSSRSWIGLALAAEVGGQCPTVGQAATDGSDVASSGTPQAGNPADPQLAKEAMPAWEVAACSGRFCRPVEGWHLDAGEHQFRLPPGSTAGPRHLPPVGNCQLPTETAKTWFGFGKCPSAG